VVRIARTSEYVLPAPKTGGCGRSKANQAFPLDCIMLVCGSNSSSVVLPGRPTLTFVAVTLPLANCVDSLTSTCPYLMFPVNPVMIGISWLAAAAAATVPPGYVHVPPDKATVPV